MMNVDKVANEVTDMEIDKQTDMVMEMMLEVMMWVLDNVQWTWRLTRWCNLVTKFLTNASGAT